MTEEKDWSGMTVAELRKEHEASVYDDTVSELRADGLDVNVFEGYSPKGGGRVPFAMVAGRGVDHEDMLAVFDSVREAILEDRCGGRDYGEVVPAPALTESKDGDSYFAYPMPDKE